MTLDDVAQLVVSAALGAIFGAIAGGLVSEVRGRKAEAREEARRARDRAREWDLKRIADTRGQLMLQVRQFVANHRSDTEAETDLQRELDHSPYPNNDVRILGADAHGIIADLFRLSGHYSDDLSMYRASRALEDRLWTKSQELRARVERGDPLELVEITPEGLPDDVRRHLVLRDQTLLQHLAAAYGANAGDRDA